MWTQSTRPWDDGLEQVCNSLPKCNGVDLRSCQKLAQAGDLLAHPPPIQPDQTSGLWATQPGCPRRIVKKFDRLATDCAELAEICANKRATADLKHALIKRHIIHERAHWLLCDGAHVDVVANEALDCELHDGLIAAANSLQGKYIKYIMLANIIP